MFYERRKNPFGPGGSSVHHHLWPFVFRLKWSADWELKYLPPLFEILTILAVGLMLLSLGRMIGHL
jgi:hypothetical protein